MYQQKRMRGAHEVHNRLRTVQRLHFPTKNRSKTVKCTNRNVKIHNIRTRKIAITIVLILCESATSPACKLLSLLDNEINVVACTRSKITSPLWTATSTLNNSITSIHFPLQWTSGYRKLARAIIAE